MLDALRPFRTDIDGVYTLAERPDPNNIFDVENWCFDKMPGLKDVFMGTDRDKAYHAATTLRLGLAKLVQTIPDWEGDSYGMLLDIVVDINLAMNKLVEEMETKLGLQVKDSGYGHARRARLYIYNKTSESESKCNSWVGTEVKAKFP